MGQDAGAGCHVGDTAAVVLRTRPADKPRTDGGYHSARGRWDGA